MSAPTAAHHGTCVAAPRGLGGAAGPLILDRQDEDFIGAMLDELCTEPGRARLCGTQAQARDDAQRLKLFQPVQRRFHLALIEAWCDTAGTPRLDPARVDAAGLVLRRVRQVRGREVHEGWMKAGGVLRGWLPVTQLGTERDASGQPSADPQAATRVARRDTGVANLDRALRALVADTDPALLEEQVTPLFVAPPEVCKKAGRSIWYGVVPTTSSELAQTEADVETLFEGFGPQSDSFKDHLVDALRGTGAELPVAGGSDPRLFFGAGYLRDLTNAPNHSAEHRFLSLLRQVAIEFDAFGEPEPSRELLRRLEPIRLAYHPDDDQAEPRTVGAVDFLRQAMAVLFDEQGGTVEMPATWPSLPDTERDALLRALSASMRERFRSVRGRPGRFDEPDAQYVLRAFIRLKPEGRCAARTLWTTPGPPFVIAPWYETGGNPVQIALPTLAAMKKLKPNVSFQLPPEMQNLLMGSPESLMKGVGQKNELGIGWICSFSIPVITFCAFIVLNIFLSLFDLIFKWMLFIKVCIPFPKVKSS